MKKEYKLTAKWDKKENEISCEYPLGIDTKRDCGWLLNVFNEVDFHREMAERGYDIETFKFEITISKEYTEKFPTLLAQL